MTNEHAITVLNMIEAHGDLAIRDAVVLLHADSPHDAWRKAVEMYERVD